MKKKNVLKIVGIIVAICVIFIVYKVFIPKSSYVITDDGNKISFKVPSKLKENKDLSDEDIRMFSNGKYSYDKNIDVSIWTNLYTVEEYMEKLEEKGQKYYVTETTDIESKTINDTVFYYKSISYKLSTSDYSTTYIKHATYICCEIEDDESIYMVEIESVEDELTEDEIEMFLNIKY